ncbi:MAG: hypothetical protein HRU19_03200 [Pseudobacteriovorax sp.]|nr:hypothetical protein [Pseudobacteriovorax sp.]
MKLLAKHIPLLIICFCSIYVLTLDSEEDRSLAFGFFVGPLIALCGFFQLVIWVGMYGDRRAEKEDIDR